MYRKRKSALIMAIVAALGIIMTGSFAWMMVRDDTRLNNFRFKGQGDSDLLVKINEDFDHSDPGGKAWDKKKVWIENYSTTDVIVRVRLEESINISGSKVSSANGSKKDIFATNSDFAISQDNKAYSKVDREDILFYLGKTAITMEEWTNPQKYNMAMTNSAGEPFWVVDTDGWCYYTAYLKAAAREKELGDKSLNLLEQIIKSDSQLINRHGNNVILDYWMNVRLQAISADLESYGPEDNSEYWTYKDGRQISHIIIDPDKEIATTSKITNNADLLVKKINALWLGAQPVSSNLSIAPGRPIDYKQEQENENPDESAEEDKEEDKEESQEENREEAGNEENKPEENKPEENKPEESKPEENKPGENITEENKPEENKTENNNQTNTQ